jgi:hypothetical protein
MQHLKVCDHCGRHVRADEQRCPFCEHEAKPENVAPRSTASLLFAMAAAATVAACYGGPQRNIQPTPAPPQSSQPAQPPATSEGSTSANTNTIGEARMLADRTLVLELRGDDLRDSMGTGEFRYPTVHPQYDEILAHLGPMQPGERRAVRRF